ncbi:MAG: hypothetical protein AAGJ11_04975 [Bacteroidota bacterium]
MSLRPVLAVALAAVLSAPASGQAFAPLEIFRVSSPDLNDSGIGEARSMAVLADLSGDGLPDLALGADDDDDGAGRVYLVSGADGATILTIPSPQNVQAEAFGHAVAALPDLDGDGREDLAVGAVEATVGALADAGRVYLVSSATGGVLRQIESPNATDGGAFGFDLARVPDVDGDGMDDLAIGAPGEDTLAPNGDLVRNAGRAYLYSAASGQRLASLVSANPDDDAPGLGSIRGSDFGFSVDGIGDLDGDGRGEVLVGAPGEWTQDFDGDPAPFDGRLYTIRPNAGQQSITRSPNAENRGDFGNCVASTADLDGDGTPDILIGAPDESLTDDNDDEGQAYLLSGATGAPLRRYRSPEPSNDSSFGTCIHTAPDLTLDGVPEVLVTEPTLCCDKMPAVYVFDGASGDLVYSYEVPYITFDIEAALGLPDLNGDGRGEIALGLSIGTFDETDVVVVLSGNVPEAEVEPNDALEEAQVLRGTSGAVVRGLSNGSDLGFNGRVTFDDGRQSIEDLYRVDLLEPGLRATLTGLENDLDLYLMTPDLTFVEVSGNGGTADETIDLPDLAAGTYYLGVDFCGDFLLGACQENASDWSPYTLTVEAALAPGVTTEPAPEAAATLGLPAPNPFRLGAEVEIALPEAGSARLALLDVLGREVAVVLDGPLPAGRAASASTGRRWPRACTCCASRPPRGSSPDA